MYCIPCTVTERHHFITPDHVGALHTTGDTNTWSRHARISRSGNLDTSLIRRQDNPSYDSQNSIKARSRDCRTWEPIDKPKSPNCHYGCSQGPSRTSSYSRGTWALQALANEADALPAGPSLRLPPLLPGHSVGDDYDLILLIDQREQVCGGYAWELVTC